MIDVTYLQRILPASVKNTLKPLYRSFYPNKLFVLFWVTFKCNYRCSYCPVVTKFDFGEIFPRNVEKKPSEWIQALDKLPSANIYISGGEPFVYKGLPEFINKQQKHSILGIVTNASAPTKIYDRVARKTHLNLSYHAEFTSQGEFIKKIRELNGLGKFHLNINIVTTRENLPIIQQLEDQLTYEGVSLHVDPFIDADMQFQYTDTERGLLNKVLQKDRINTLDRLNFYSYINKKCSAGRNYINIMPNGEVYRCAAGFEYFYSPLRKDVLSSGPNAPYDPAFFYMGNIFDDSFRLDTKDINCGLPCPAACDRDMAKITILA